MAREYDDSRPRVETTKGQCEAQATYVILTALMKSHIHECKIKGLLENCVQCFPIGHC